MIDVYALPGEAVFPEGITAGPDGVTFYVSSSRDGTIFRGRTDRPEAEVWLPAGADGRTRATGLAVDAFGRLLVCGWKTRLLLGYDTETGALVARHEVPDEKAGLNDVCVHDGYAYVTDSGRPRLWRFSLTEAGVGEPELWRDLAEHGASAEPFTDYLNGIVPTPDGSALIVAAQGAEVLWRVGLTDDLVTPVEIGQPVCGDGLAFVDGTLYLCDNSEEADGVHMWLSAVTFEPGYRRGTLVHRWERPRADTPTTLAHLDDRLYLVNSQFAAERAGAVVLPFTVIAIPVPAND